MAELSQSELKAIKDYPTREGLETFRKAFTSRYLKCENANVIEVVDQLTSEASDTREKGVILDLMLALAAQPAARILLSRSGNGPLTSDIAIFYARLATGREHAAHVAPLLKLVVTQSGDVVSQTSDIDIWAAVLVLIARTTPIPQPTTPPISRPSFRSSFQQTPSSFNTGGLEDTSESRKQIDEALKQELLSSLRIDIPDFIDTVFGHVPRLDELAEVVFDRCQEGDAPRYKESSGWTLWPRIVKEEFVLEWLQDLIGRFPEWLNQHGVYNVARRRIYQGPSIYLDGSPVKRKMDVGITACNGRSQGYKNGVDETPDARIPSWTNILVTGELKSNPVEDGQTPVWLDLATYVREVFRTQDRRFVLGFTLCGSMMRLWHFDRSGSSGSSSFNINEDGLKFIHVMLGYCLMNDTQLGFDPTIQQVDGKRYIKITRNNKIEQLILTEDIKKQAVIVGRATTCWKAYRDGDLSKEPLVVKDSWQYEERPEEGEFIKQATDKGVRNIARYYHHETVQVGGKNDDTIENVRRGLMKTCGRTTFRQKLFDKPEAPASEFLCKSVPGRTQSESLSRKRLSGSTQMASSSKRSSSFESRNSRLQTYNRVHRRTITLDLGKPINKTSSPVAIINGFIGAIEGHESLLNAGILHRDISIGNIMLTENEDNGFLIDLDLAIKTSNDQASGAPGRTGTKIFMAIGALLGEPHNFMHDLESFFWVLFWICIHYDGLDEKGKVERRIVPKYEKWNYAGTEELAETKIGQISTDIFDMVDVYFTKHCKPLIPCLKELHKVVFPEGRRWFTEHQGLYSDMKRILEKARDSLKS